MNRADLQRPAEDRLLDASALLERCISHGIEDLVKLAGLEAERGQAISANPNLGTNWLIARDWTVESRYKQVPESRARELENAVTDGADGVLPWIRGRW